MMKRIFVFTLKLFAAFLLGAFAFGEATHAAGTADFAFTILGPDGAVARVITADATCPQITIDGNVGAMSVRAAPDADFPVTVCAAAIPLTAKSVSVNGQALKLPKAQPQRIVVVGDTGCRLKGSTVQSCNDAAKWPFEQLAVSATNTNPDLVIHVGDYHYREAECIPEKADCAGSPWGDNWAAWNADLFTPAQSLLQAAPWVITPGNHEDCARAGIGYFRLLDPRPMPATCPQYTDPYALNYMDPQLIVLDDSAVNDFQIEPEQAAIYQKQFEQINTMAKGTTWLLMHDPLYVFGHLGEKDGKEQLLIDQLTLQQASNNTFPKSIQAIMGGHIHLFQVLSFDGTRPPQLVVGNSGTLLDKPITTPLAGLEIGGMKVSYGTMRADFGFVTMTRAGDEWAMRVKDVAGADKDRCVLGGGTLVCGQTVLPSTGGDFSSEGWLMLALGGGVLLVLGVVVYMRGGKAQKVETNDN